MKKLLYVAPHLSTGGAPQYLLKKLELLNKEYDVHVIEFQDFGIFRIQKDQIIDILKYPLITLQDDKYEIMSYIKLIRPDIIHFEEMPELFDEEFCSLIRKQCVKAYEAESAIIEWSVNGYQSEHLTSDIMKNFIKNRLNESLEQIGIEPVFDDVSQELLDKTLWFDEDVLGNTATDFFYKRPTEYSKNDKSYDEDDLF